MKGDTFALDLYAGFDAAADLLDNAEVSLTSEVSGSKTYTSESIHPSLGDSEENVTGLMTLSEIAESSNRYLQNVYKNDLEGKYPFGEDGDILMLLSANGAAYTAKSNDITLAAGERMLVSFFVKTSEIANGLTGANATLVDGENRTSLTAFDSNTVDTVDIDDETKDIYDGWVQCFFFLTNETDEDKTCHIEFTYGPTSIVSTDRYDYADGYAAFANFETRSLTRTEYSYASTGDRAVKVSLTGKASNASAFDKVSATARKDLEVRPALPASFKGTLGGSTAVDPDSEISNVKPENVYAGLLDTEYADNYYASEEAWRSILDTSAANGDEWWTGLFGNANRPLVIANGEEASYGFISEDISLSASSAQRVSMRIRLSADAKAYVYLTDTTDSKSAGKTMTVNAPLVTYWYDDNGNICRIDLPPTSMTATATSSSPCRTTGSTPARAIRARCTTRTSITTTKTTRATLSPATAPSPSTRTRAGTTPTTTSRRTATPPKFPAFPPKWAARTSPATTTAARRFPRRSSKWTAPRRQANG